MNDLDPMATYKFSVIDCIEHYRMKKIKIMASIKKDGYNFFNQVIYVKVNQGSILHNNQELIKIPNNLKTNFIAHLKIFIKGYLTGKNE